MAHLFYYWRGDNYRRDLDYGVGFHLNQSSSRLHLVDIGESLWAITRRQDGVYVLAAELVIKAKTLNQKNYRYGRYRVWGDLRRSRYFSVDGQPDISGFVRDQIGLSARGDVLGRAFQGKAAVRTLSEAQHLELLSYAKPIHPEPRARLLPEEELEALMLLDDPAAVRRLILDEDPGLAVERRTYLHDLAIKRNRELVTELREMYSGICQITGWNPRELYGYDLCEAHHIRWLSRGGEDDVSNMILIAPNIHRAVHRADAPFDWQKRSFMFPELSLPLESVSAGHELIDQ